MKAKSVVVVMHSYGRLVGSNAMSKELSIAHRSSADLPGGAVHLFYFAAFVLDKDLSMLSAFEESPNSDVKIMP